jgi:hypothetical protein
MKADAQQLLCIKAILNSYAQSTGLKINYSKSSMMPIGISEERLDHFANTMQCKKGSLPFSYLGLPLSITTPSLEYFLPIVQRVERRLGGIADFLDYGGNLLIVKSVLSSLPIFFMCCLDIPVSIKKQCVKFMRYCLWRKKNNEVQSNGPALVAWEKICRPKDQGGLGVLDLRTQNEALLLKNLHKIFNRLDIPWVKLIWNTYYNQDKLPSFHLEGSFWWKTHLELLDKYKGMSRSLIGDGKSTLFWTNLWNDTCLHQKFPHLVSFARKTSLSVH